MQAISVSMMYRSHHRPRVAHAHVRGLRANTITTVPLSFWLSLANSTTNDMSRPANKEERRRRNSRALGLAIIAISQVKNLVPIELAKGLLAALTDVLTLFQVWPRL